MRTPGLRYVSILIATLAAGVVLYAAMGQPRGVGNPRWPTADSLFEVDGWSTGPERSEQGGFVSRNLVDSRGRVATLSLFSNQAPKLYAAGAEVPFLGNGYSVQKLAGDDGLPSPGDGISALTATRGTEQWLVLYAYGERRGLLGNGVQAWAFALFDGLLGRSNDYYKVYLAARMDGHGASSKRDLTQLAGTLFPRIADFYAG